MADNGNNGGFLLSQDQILDLVKMYTEPGRKPTCFLEGLDDGQSTDKNHNNQIELNILSEVHGQQDVSGFGSALAEGGVGRATSNPVICVAVFNNASPKIAQLAATGEPITKDLKIHLAVASEGGAKDYGVIELPNPSMITFSTIVDTGKGKAAHIFAIGPSQTKWKHGTKEAGFNWTQNAKT